MLNQKLLRSGLAALRGERYSEAVEILEQLCDNLDLQSQDYFPACRALIKAYQGNGQQEKAIKLCQKLTTDERGFISMWAAGFLPKLTPPPEIDIDSSTECQSAENNPTLKPKTLAEFKNYCQCNLVPDLKKFESVRKKSVRAIFISGLIFILFASFSSYGVLFNSLAIKNMIFPGDVKSTPTLTVTIKEDSEQTTSEDKKLVYTQPEHIASVHTQTKRPRFRRRRRYSSLEFRTHLIFLFFSLLLLFTSLIVWVAFYSSCTDIYSKGFKETIIESIIDFLAPENLKYESFSTQEETHNTKLDLTHSQIFPGTQSSYTLSQSDCVFGEIGKTSIFFSAICAQREFHHGWLSRLTGLEILRFRSRITAPFIMVLMILGLSIKVIKGFPYIVSRISQGRRVNYTHFNEEIVNNKVSRNLIFQGLFLSANFYKKFAGKVTVIPNSVTSKIKVINQQKGEIINLEDPEFAKFFTVYGDDQVETRYILSTSLMRRLVKFRKKANRDIYISFVENQLYIAIKYDQDLLEPMVFKKMLSFTPLREYFENLQLMLGVVDDLNLNQQIWS